MAVNLDNVNYILLNSDGSVLTQKMDYYVQQGSSGVDKIFFGMVGALTTDSGIAICTMANGQQSTLVGVWDTCTYPIEGVDTIIGGYVFTLNSTQTTYPGSLRMSLTLYRGDTRLATYPLYLVINETGLMPDTDTGVTIEEINSYLQQVQQMLRFDNGIIVIEDISMLTANSEYQDGQLFYCKTNKQYYEKISDSPYYKIANDYTGLLGSKRTIVRWENWDGSLLQLFNRNGTRPFIIRPSFFTTEFLVQFIPQDESTPSAIRVLNLSTLETKYATTSDFSFASKGFGEFMTDSRWYDDILHESNYKDFAVPYSGATDNVDLNGHSLEISKTVNNTDGSIKILVNAESFGTQGYLQAIGRKNINGAKYERARYHSYGVQYTPDMDTPLHNFSLRFPQSSGVFATEDFVNSVVETLKANAFILVDTTTYPTLEDFLESDGEDGYIYLYPSTNEEEGYLEYIWESNGWLQIGTTQIDLTGYYTKTESDDKFVPYTGATKHVDLGVYYIRAGQIIGKYNAIIGDTTDSSKTYMHIEPNAIRFIKGSWVNQRGYFAFPLSDTPSYIDEPEIIATREYVASYTSTTYVAKTSTGDRVYGTDELGNQRVFEVDSDIVANYDGVVVRREKSSGAVAVGNPSQVYHATPKSYVDNAIANAISNVYRIKGSKTVAQLNALTSSELTAGDVYNLLDSGTLTAGSLQVFTGDNVVWTGSAWDKLGTEIDWSAYDEKFMAAGFFEVQNYNESTGEITMVYATELYDMSYNSDTGVMTIEAN